MADKLMRQRAEEFWRAKVSSDGNPVMSVHAGQEIISMLAAFADQIRLEDAKAVCPGCAEGFLLTTNGELELRHYRLAENGYTKMITGRCFAEGIHELRRKEGEGNG